LKPPRILFIANAGPEVGGGHVMRSLTLSNALTAQGAEVAFLAPPEVRRLLEVFGPGVAIHDITSAEPGAIVAGGAPLKFDAVVFDHYGLAQTDHQAVAGGRVALVIDDLADRPLAADIVLDPGPARMANDYDGLIGDARLLLGPGYAPVRPAFAALRDATLKRRGGPVRRVLVALGLTDVGGVTRRVVERLQRIDADIALDVVVGSAAGSLPALHVMASIDPRIVLHVDARDMAELTAAADIAVGAAGSTTWERCILGLPSVLLVLAENQRPAAGALAARNAALVVDAADPGFEAALDRAVGRLMADEALRRDISTASAALCDGRGGDRVAETFLAAIANRHP